MDQFQQELAQMARLASLGGSATEEPTNPLFNVLNQDQNPQQQRPDKRPPLSKEAKELLSKYSQEELIQMYEKMLKGEMPKEMQSYQESYLDENGKPIIDNEGGAVIQPEAGFVVKTKDGTGQKVFINMTKHDVVEGFEEKAIPQGDREKLGSDVGVRIPLSLGSVREDYDKKGEVAQVYDVIWNPKTIDRCKTDAPFRQVVVELAFNHILQKYKHSLDLRFTIPKMKYKGTTVQFQRVRAKKGPKIQEMDMTEEQRKQLESQSFQHQKKKMVEEIVENTPEWQLYCVLNNEKNVLSRFDKADFWDKLVGEMLKRSEETGVGDLKDRQETLAQSFRLPIDPDTVEEFDGMNHEEAYKLIFVVSLPVIMRGHSIQLKVSSELLSVRVPNIYSLRLGLPRAIDTSEVKSFFECKLRKLFIVLTIKQKQVYVPAPESQTQVEEDEEYIEEVDMSRTIEEKDYKKYSSKPSAPSKVDIVDAQKLENDMLFDIV